jgi:hypothetical protein
MCNYARQDKSFSPDDNAVIPGCQRFKIHKFTGKTQVHIGYEHEQRIGSILLQVREIRKKYIIVLLTFRFLQEYKKQAG